MDFHTSEDRTTDAAWRQHSRSMDIESKQNFWSSSPTDEVPTLNCHGHLLLCLAIGSGKAFAGTSLNLQGGETVIGFFADNDKQQPVIFGCYQSEAFHENNAYPENADGSTMFYEMEARELVFGENACLQIMRTQKT